jgi:tRNA (guanine26-N2/guanine27-N2)-dimethyltransferase
MFKKKLCSQEEGIKIPLLDEKISKKLSVFYNPEMKTNRDISLLLINSYFTKQISFCDPMSATGIRELRFLKKIPHKFKSIHIGDISKRAIKDIKNNFRVNKISKKKIKFSHDNAINTINKDYYDFIEIDPFGSPIPFLDIAIQKIKHNGILSVTATDTAPLCGTYPKTALRKYGVKTEYTYFYEELGLRNLIAYIQKEGAKYEKSLSPIISYTHKHYYKIFFKVEESRTNSYNLISKIKYISWNKNTQEIKKYNIEKDNLKDDEILLGPTYIGLLNQKDFLKELISNLNLIEDSKEIEKLLNNLVNELDTIGHYNIHKLQSRYKLKEIKFPLLIKKIQKAGFDVSKPHNSKFTLKTTASSKELRDIINSP